MKALAMLETVLKCINESGFRGRESLKQATDVTDQQIDEWVAAGHLCILSGNQIDIPQRRDERLAYWEYLKSGGELVYREWLSSKETAGI